MADSFCRRNVGSRFADGEDNTLLRVRNWSLPVVAIVRPRSSAFLGFRPKSGLTTIGHFGIDGRGGSQPRQTSSPLLQAKLDRKAATVGRGIMGISLAFWTARIGLHQDEVGPVGWQIAVEHAVEAHVAPILGIA